MRSAILINADFITQRVQQIDELKHAVVGGEIGKDCQATSRCLNYNVVFVVFTYGIKAI